MARDVSGNAVSDDMAPPRRPRAFVAVPCGDFYAVQAQLIRDLLSSADVEPYIAEDKPDTKGLWDSISAEIDKADIFIADISSKSPNILLEVGYAIARKPIGATGLFIAERVDVPADLRWMVVQIYSSLTGFRGTLASWLEKALPISRTARVTAPVRREVFTEDFMSDELFLRRWALPPACSYLLTSEGLRFSNAHFPILTTPLAILGDCEFEFQGRVDRQQLGWAVKGTKAISDLFPSFCVMFALNVQGVITPHIWSVKRPNPKTHYQVFSRSKVPSCLQPTPDRWFAFITRVIGDIIEIEIDGCSVFKADFAAAEFADIYSSIAAKEGQVGFRCHPGEQATVRCVRVRALESGGVLPSTLQPTSRKPLTRKAKRTQASRTRGSRAAGSR